LSATNRGAVRARGDYYRTPDWVIDHAIEILSQRFGASPFVLDAGCGDGAILARFESAGFEGAGFELDHDLCVAARKQRAGDIVKGCFLRDPFPVPPSAVCVMNPPFSLAREFVERSIALGMPTLALLRLSFLASKKRVSFWREHAAHVYVLPRRPSFTGNGLTDSCDYAWFLFGACVERRWEML